MTFETQAPRSRILTSVVALLFVAGAVPLGLLGERLAAFNRGWLEAQQKEHQLVLAEAIALELGELVRAKRAEVAGFALGLEAAMEVVDSALTLAVVEESALLNRMLEDSDDVAQLILARPTGTGTEPSALEFVVAERGDDPDPLAAAVEVLVSSLLERAFRGESLLHTPEAGPPILIVVQPLQNKDRVAGVLAALVRLDGLPARLAHRSERLYLIHVATSDGRRLLGASRQDVRPDLLESDLVRAFESDGGMRTMPFRASVGDRDREMLGAFASVPATGWGVFVEVEAETAYLAVHRMRQTTLRWTLGSMLLALLLGTLFARRLVSPLRELAEGALRLARGDFRSPLAIDSGNEIGLLASSLNHMADELREKIQLLEQAAVENKDLFLGSIRMLAEAIDEKDPYTRGHSERVSRYAVALGRSLGLAPEELEKVQIGALLHDVGKIGIDDRILRKPTILTDAEFEIMRQHPDKGAHIMSAVEQLTDIIPGMRFHHERVDGSGYPLGLKGDEIPLVAQIISVVDTFDAMTTDRPYQRAMEPEFVIEKLRGWVGVRFRGDVVEAFARALADGLVELRRPVTGPVSGPSSVVEG